MSREPAKRQILDDDQKPHDYLVIAHPAAEGLRLATQLFALIGPSLGKLVDGLKGKGGDVLAEDLDVGELVAEVASGVAEADVPKLAQNLMRHCVRDKVSLDSEASFNQAYSANYGELTDALAAVVEVNGFLRFFTRLAGKMQARQA